MEIMSTTTQWMQCKVHKSTFSNERVVELGNRDFVVPADKVKGEPGGDGRVEVKVFSRPDGKWAEIPTANSTSIPINGGEDGGEPERVGEMDDIEILSRIRELRDRCEDLVVRFRGHVHTVTTNRLSEAWTALTEATVEFRIAAEEDLRASKAPASGISDSAVFDTTKPHVEPGENNG